MPSAQRSVGGLETPGNKCGKTAGLFLNPAHNVEVIHALFDRFAAAEHHGRSGAHAERVRGAVHVDPVLGAAFQPTDAMAYGFVQNFGSAAGNRIETRVAQASDRVAQAEHDPDARVGLIALSEEIVEAVQTALENQLDGLTTKEVALASITNGFAMRVSSLQDGATVCNLIAPEHLSLHITESDEIVPLLENYGAIFIGDRSAEVFGDYGLGPNHVLPTGGASRYRGGLSVLDFLRVRTWMKLEENPEHVTSMIASFARMEGLEAHARSSEIRAMTDV